MARKASTTVKKRVRTAASRPASTVRDIAMLKDQAQHEWMRAKKNFQHAQTRAQTYMKKNPEKAVLIAAGVGAAIATGLTYAATRKHKK